MWSTFTDVGLFRPWTFPTVDFLCNASELGSFVLGCRRKCLWGWLDVPSPARQSWFSLSHGRVLGSRKRCKARGRVLVGCWVSVHGFGVPVRLRGLERVLVVFGG